MNMTYKDLLNKLNSLSEEQLNQNVTIFHGSQDEFYPVYKSDFAHENDVLDKDHFYLQID